MQLQNACDKISGPLTNKYAWNASLLLKSNVFSKGGITQISLLQTDDNFELTKSKFNIAAYMPDREEKSMLDF